MNIQSEPLVDPERTNTPLELSEALQGALERLSEALTDSSHSLQPALQAVWDIEDILTAETLADR